MNHQKPLPLSAEQIDRMLQGEKSVDDIVKEAGAEVREGVAEIFRTRRTATSKSSMRKSTKNPGDSE